MEENLGATPWDFGAGEIAGVYVRDMWSRVKDEVAPLPDEVLDAVRFAYAQAARYDGLVEYVRSSSRLAGDFSGLLRSEGQKAGDAFEAARDVLRHYLMQESVEE